MKLYLPNPKKLEMFVTVSVAISSSAMGYQGLILSPLHQLYI